MPGQSKEPFIPKQKICEERDGENEPGVSASPRGEWQDPGAIPGMQDRTKDKRNPEYPNYPALPISTKQKGDQHNADNKDDIVMIIFLVRVRPDGFFNEPPEKIVQSRHMG